MSFKTDKLVNAAALQKAARNSARRECKECGIKFTPAQPNYVLCYDCYGYSAYGRLFVRERDYDRDLCLFSEQDDAY